MIHVELHDDDMIEIRLVGKGEKLSKEFAALLCSAWENGMKDIVFHELDNIIRECEKK